MLGSRSFLGGRGDGYDVGSKRQRMSVMDSNPYFAVNDSSSGYPSYRYGGSYFQSFPVVRLRGLPFDCADSDIFAFFSDLDVLDVLLVNKSGRFSGEAFVLFARPVHAEFALQKDKHMMGPRYVEVFRCVKREYYSAIAAEVHYEGIYDNDYRGSPSPNRPGRVHETEYGTEILRLRGLPFSVTRSQIVDFFEEFEVAEEKIHIAYRPDGRTTGEAYVEFDSAVDAKKAMSKDKMMIGSRYIELFSSSSEEARRAKSRSRR